MNKSFKVFGIIFIVVILIIFVLQLGSSEEVSWDKNYSINEKTPFGLYIFDEQAPKLLKTGLEKVDASPYDYYEDEKNYQQQNILLINQELDDESWKKVMNRVNQGSDVLLISDRRAGVISDTLNLNEDQLNYEDINQLNFTDPKIQDSFLNLDKYPGRVGFDYLPSGVDILGSTYADSGQGANFIKISHGKGHVYYHTEPLFLTNYYLLKPQGDRYLEAVFSYLPSRKTLWFTGKSQSKDSASILSFILANPALRYAWYLLLVSLVVFAIFNAKRKQRIIPIIKPLENKSVEFAKSIGNLYLQEGNFHDMMGKKAQYFLHKIRMEFYLDTQDLDENFINKLHLKTGKPLSKIKEAVSYIVRAQNPHANVQKEDLVKMNSLLDEILK